MDGVGQGLAAAPVFAQVCVNAPAIGRHGVGARILRLHQDGQRGAFLVVSIAVPICIVNPRGGIGDAVIADLGQHVHSQVDPQLLRKRREGLLALHGQRGGAQFLCFIINHAIFRESQSRRAKREGQQEEHHKNRACFLHIRSPPSHSRKTASTEPNTDRGAAIAANRPQNLPQLTGRSPTSFPVWPFMAKRKSFPFHLVFSIQTGIRA